MEHANKVLTCADFRQWPGLGADRAWPGTALVKAPGCAPGRPPPEAALKIGPVIAGQRLSAISLWCGSGRCGGPAMIIRGRRARELLKRLLQCA
jgi:hypothetical protein